VSSQLDCEARHLFLAQAHAECGGAVNDADADAALRALDIAVDRAMVAVECALDATVLADHAHLAQIHLMDADGALKDLAHRNRR
jgi:hypothetical protein